jgi:hypothetical protein
MEANPMMSLTEATSTHPNYIVPAHSDSIQMFFDSTTHSSPFVIEVSYHELFASIDQAPRHAPFDSFCVSALHLLQLMSPSGCQRQ